MSRPIYEPSLPRADAELGYGSRQLFRRPAPQSTTEAAVPWIRRSRLYTDTPEPISDSGNQLLHFTAVDGSTTPDYTDYWSFSNNFDTQMQTDKGVYEIYGELLWNVSFDEGVRVFVHDDVGFSTQMPTYHQIPNQGDGGATYFQVRRRLHAFQYVGFTVAVYPEPSPLPELDAYYVEFHHVGTYTGTDPIDSEIEQ